MTSTLDTSTTEQDIAASTIQKNFRGFKDRLKVREQAAFNISQLIEYSEEQDHLNLNKFFSRWIQLIKANKNNDVSKHISELNTRDTDEVVDESKIEIESDYKGPRVSDTFSQDEFKDLLKSFKNSDILHAKYALMILNKGSSVLKKLKNLNQIQCFDSKDTPDVKVNVIGDLHGQFIDLYTIFENFGLPSTSNIYLFNGDFVDRGPQQCEVFFSLLYAVVLYKDSKCFFLNRGNHEDYGCSVRFGFKEEIMNKYVLYSKAILKKCREVFTRLPIGSIVNQETKADSPPFKVLVVHGGISQDTDLDVLSTMDRTRFDSIDGSVDSTLSEKEKKQKIQLQDLLWSDPQSNNGCVFNSQRHIAKKFGPDTTEMILKKFDLALLIRSHECKNNGYEFQHNNKCLTVFSASNYCGGSNKAAICVLKPYKKLEIKQFVAPGYENERNNERIELFEKKAIRNLKRLLYANRVEIMKKFNEYDKKNTGYLSLNDWSEALTKSMGIANIPWVRYKDMLVTYDEKKSLVKYETSFENCDILYTFSTESKDINHALARYKDTLVALFNLIDDNHSGTINLVEFANACKIIFTERNEAISDNAIKSMIEAMDSNKDGKIDLTEFQQAFVIYV